MACNGLCKELDLPSAVKGNYRQVWSKEFKRGTVASPIHVHMWINLRTGSMEFNFSVHQL